MDAGKLLSVAGSLDSVVILGKKEGLDIGERRLPLGLEHAREYLDQSEALRKGLRDNFVTKYLAVNEVRSSKTPVDLSTSGYRNHPQTLQEHLSADQELTELNKAIAMYQKTHPY